MPIKLPQVTLVVIDSVTPELSRLAIEDTLREIEPFEVLIWSSKPLQMIPTVPGCVFLRCCEQETASFDDVARVLWHDVARSVKTSHILTIQYDGWVLDGEAWRPEWLECDYIGAPWPWRWGGYAVGNGGFSLRSTRLMRFLAEHADRFPVRHPEDDVLCRTYRPALEEEGFVWASVREAGRFSFEREMPRATFGFHGLFNWPHVLKREALLQRIDLANDYVRGKVEWPEMMAGARRVLGAPAA